MKWPSLPDHLRHLLKSPRQRNFTAAPQMDSSSSSSSFSTTASERYSYHPTLRWNPQVEEYFVKAYGADHFARISRALTCPSCYSCIRVNTLRSTSDAVIEKLISILHERTLPSGIKSSCINENDATAEVANDARQVNSHKEFDLHPSSDLYSRQSTRLFGNEDISNGKSETPSILRCQLPGLDYVVFVKGSGPHMLQYGGAFGQSSKEVIVSRRCAEAVLRGAQIFVPGVLACSAHVETGDTVAVSVAVEQPGPDSDWNVGITRGIVLQGLQSDPHYHERSGLYIGQGTTMASRAGIFRASKGIAVEMTNRVYKLPSFHDVLEGEIFLQNLPSILAAHVLDPQQGERILDMCAAPGGKTTAIATLMRDKGEVVAVDRSHNKVMDILKLAKEMGLTCISAYKLDALKAVRQIDKIVDIGSINSNKEISSAIIVDSRLVGAPDIVMCPANAEELNLDLTTKKCEGNGITNQTYLSKADVRKSTRRMRNGPGRNNCIGGRVENSKGYLPNSFDRVLLDAPCSALGLRPRLFAGEETIESLRKHARYQRRMFDQAVQLVRPGGIIVYSTCTINPGENEALVRYALDTYKFLSLASQHPRIGGPGLVGNCELFDGKYKEDWLTESEAELVQRFDPSSSLDTIGFFIAKFNVGQKAA